ncbi:Phospholipase B1, membrane-associated [Toxocara canis]|uniref:Phospholipase B1, membrane-associated n=1 Tax=Toxocara canis TaxID=6265 RepID=A0A0B2W3C0_TOXCA|nr:Phospholipase B1, membrane-associated [Toxocara canis]
MSVIHIIVLLTCCATSFTLNSLDSRDSTETILHETVSDNNMSENTPVVRTLLPTRSGNALGYGSLSGEEQKGVLSSSTSVEEMGEDEEEEDAGDSDVSEEKNAEDFAAEKLTQARLPGAADSQQPPDAVSLIFNSFNNRKTFSCPRTKTDFVTGTGTGDLSPEDIGIIAAMGDSLATGTGLWPHTDIEFRGAAFPIGGDATIDGLVTVPNILHEFNDKLAGVSHGMGTRNQLPAHQLNVAEGGATSSSMPEQARELVRRMKALREVDADQEWAMVIITIGTEEVDILHEFNDKLAGVSHGMGTRNQLPAHQLNVAEGGATSSSMPEQARELVRRMKALREVDADQEWAMVIITIGTEEICTQCEPPDYDSLLEALLILSKGIRKAFVVLLGPIHVSSSYQQQANLLKSRCGCSKERSDEFMRTLSKEWANAFKQLQSHFDSPPAKRRTFGLLALPMLTITSRYPYSLFIANRPLLNRKGHMYATKWLWNRLITGPTYNLSLAVLSEDAYYCPAMGCPYFRTAENRHYCRLLRHIDVIGNDEDLTLEGGPKTRRSRKNLYVTAAIVIVIAFCTVISIGSLLYQMSKQGTRGRYEPEPKIEPRKVEPAMLEEDRQSLLQTRPKSISVSSFSSAR